MINKNLKKRLTSFVVALTVVFTMLPIDISTVSAQGKDIVILHTNDTHGRAVDSGGMGLSSVSAIKKQYEKAGATVLLLDAGDTLHGLPFATIDKGESVVELMNLVGYDVMAPGNHDFNYGTTRLIELVGKMDFPLIAANVLKKSDGSSLFKEYTIIEKDGVKFGIFGLASPETSYKTNPMNVETVTFGNPIKYTQTMVNKLKAENVDYIIALAHIGQDGSTKDNTMDILAQVKGIDVYIDGHSHTVLEKGMVIGDTLVASAGEYHKYLGVVTIMADGAKKAELIAAADVAEIKDATIDKAVETIKGGQAPLLNEVIATTSVDLDGARETNRKEETNFGNLTADALRAVTGADIGATNGGGIRASINAGEITKGQISTVFPFGNYAVTIEVTGQELKDALEISVGSYPELLGGFLQVSGITFSFNKNGAKGDRIDVKDVMVGSEILDLNKTYIMAVNDFIAAGGDGYTMLKKPVINEFGALEEIVSEYINSKPAANFAVGGRIIPVDGEMALEGKTADTSEMSTTVAIPSAEMYVIKAGDTFWSIAKRAYGNGSKWESVMKANPSIKSPKHLKVGQEIKIPAA